MTMPAILRPIGGSGRVIVRRDPDPDKSTGGIVLPPRSRKHAQLGTVLAVHAGVVRPSEVQPGDRVLFGLYAGTDIERAGETVTVMPEDEIMAVLT